MTERTVSCTDACGVPPIPDDEQAIALHGWQRLHITGRYRCLTCHQQLQAVNARSSKRDAVIDWNKASTARTPADAPQHSKPDREPSED